MDLHKLLKRQLKKVGLDENTFPTTIEDWQQFIDCVNKSYHQADMDRYLQDQSMMIVTTEMNELNDKLSTLQKVGHLGYWHTNLVTGVRTWSKELYTMFGLQLGMPVPKLEKIYEMIHEDDLVFFKKYREQAISNNIPFEMEIRFKKLDGTNRYNWYYLIGYPHISTGTNQKILHHIVMDIHRHKLNEDKIATLQKAVIQSEKMAIIGQLSAGIAHEINNPLSYALGNMSILQARLQLILKILDAYQTLMSEIQKHQFSSLKEYNDKILGLINHKNLPKLITYLNDIITESTDGLLRIKDIVSKMQNFAGTEKPRMDLININDCILSAIEMVNKESSNCRIQKELSDLPSILGSYSQLVIVFVDLLLNAQQAIQENRKNGTIRVTSKVVNSKIRVSISDNGVGIPPENSSKIFTPFFTTKPTGSGTGLGLATVYGIVKLHDGTVTFESENENGSIFTIELPIKQTPDGQSSGES